MKKYLIILSFIFTSFAFGMNSFIPNSGSIEQNKILSAKEAFPLEIEKLKDNKIEVIFDIKEGYYLYKNKININLNNKKINIALPSGEKKEDPFFGKTTIIRYGFSVDFDQENTRENIIKVQYQGCSEKNHICYPEEIVEKTFINKNLKKDNSIKNTAVELTKTNDANAIVNYLVNNISNVSIYFVFIFIGILIAFTPCIYPMMPIIIASTSQSKNVKVSAISYIFGMILCYFLLGVITGVLNFNIQIFMQNKIVIYIISGILLVLACFMFGFINMIIPDRFNNTLIKKINGINPDKYRNQVLIGFLSSLVLSPCSIAPLLGVLIFINQMNQPLLGGILLGCMALGIGIPLFILTTSFSRFMPKNGKWMNEVKNIIGVVLILISLYLLKGYIDLYYLYLVTTFIVGIYVIYLTTKEKIRKIIMLIYTILIILIGGLYSNNINIFNLNIERINNNGINLKYVEVSNSKELKNQIQNETKPIFIDYYADWCVTCVHMNNTVFKNKEIIEYLNKDYTVIKINLTDLDSSKKEIMNENNILAIPYYVFIDKNKKEFVYTGELNENTFLNLLKKYNEESNEK